MTLFLANFRLMWGFIGASTISVRASDTANAFYWAHNGATANTTVYEEGYSYGIGNFPRKAAFGALNVCGPFFSAD